MKKILPLIFIILIFVLFNPPQLEKDAKIIKFYAFLNNESKFLFHEIADNYNKKTGINVEIVNVPMNIFKERFYFLSHTSPPDLIMIPNDWIGNFAERNLISSLEFSYIDKFNFSNECRESVKLFGKYFAVPFIIETPVLIFNTDLVKKPPETYSELKKYSLSGENDLSILFDIKSPYIISYFINSEGGKIDVNGEIESEINSDAIKLAFDIVTDNKINKNLDVDYSVMINLFQRGELPMMIDGPWSFNSLTNSGVPFDVIPLPRNKRRRTAFYSIKCLAIPENARNAKEAEDFSKYLLSKEVARMIASHSHMVLAGSDTNYSEYSKAVSASLKNATLLPNKPGMEKFWNRVTKFLNKIIISKERSQL